MSLTVHRTITFNQVQHMMTTTTSISFSDSGLLYALHQIQNPSKQQSTTTKENENRRSSTFSPRISALKKTIEQAPPLRKSKVKFCQEPPTSSLPSKATKGRRSLYKEAIGAFSRLSILRARPSDDSDDDEEALIAPCTFRQRAFSKKLIRMGSVISNNTNTSSTLKTLDSTLPDDYSFMSHGLPITTETTKVVFRKQRNNRNIVIEDTGGELIGSIDSSSATKWGTRILKDATGHRCAVIHKKVHNALLGDRSPATFRVYCDKPCYFGQNPSKHQAVYGCYFWAEIKNKGYMGGSFVMKRQSPQGPSCNVDRHCAKQFGSLFSKGKSKGYVIVDREEKECAKMFSLGKNRNKGIVIAPNRDMCLMLAFSAVVDEMVEHHVNKNRL